MRKVDAFDFQIFSSKLGLAECISVLEHIRNNGDSLLMATISRILKKGGRAVISFPFNNGDYIEEESPLGIGYFQRKYNIIEIQRRIIQPANLIGSIQNFLLERQNGN